MPSRKYIRPEKNVFIYLLIFGLIFLIAGGFGLFHVNINVVSGSEMWFYGNIIFGVFTLVGIMIIIFLAIFNAEID
jgi:hypothetical protein